MLDEVIRDTTAFGGLPLFLAVTAISYGVNQDLGIKLFTALVVCYVITIAIRVIWFRERPKKEKFRNIIEKVDASSFPSLHSMRATVLALMLGKVLINPIQQGILALCWIGACYTRVYLKRHYITDVLGGVGFGIVVALVLLQ